MYYIKLISIFSHIYAYNIIIITNIFGELLLRNKGVIKMKDRFLIIGTAGHVDHGKTQLIQSLTGISTDRLKEEKERGISIELGYAYLTLPDGRKAGIVDVPGHEKFVRQMLAGASGMDVVLLVIAADEGIMPQTKEHLDILTLLKIDKGIIVITKIDLVDEEWLAMIEQDILEKLKNTIFAQAPLCKVSAVTGEGKQELLNTINEVLAQGESRKTDRPARMPIDRVFTVQGFGTVVTGTLGNGIFKKGQDACLEPGGQRVKIRNIQIHGEQANQAMAGQRAAINLSGISTSDIPRGVNLVHPQSYKTGQILDVELFNLPEVKKVIQQRQRVRFHIGTSEVLGRIHLLEQEELPSGETSFAQIILEHPVLAAEGDRFVIRFYSPVITIGGGTVLGISPYKKKRFKDNILKELRLKAEGSTREILMGALEFPLSLTEIIKVIGLGKEEIEQQLIALKQEDLITVLWEDGTELFWLNNSAERWAESVAEEILKHQKKFPLRRGIGREELRKTHGINLVLRRWQLILEWGAAQEFYNIAANQITSKTEPQLPEKIQKELNSLLLHWEKAGLNPPDLQKGAVDCGVNSDKISQYAGYLTTSGKWVNFGDFYFDRKEIDKARDILVDYLKQKEKISAAEARDLWQTSRKYAVPLLEYFDSIKLTKRENLVRYLTKSSS